MMSRQPMLWFGSKKNADNANKMKTTPPIRVTETKQKHHSSKQKHIEAWENVHCKIRQTSRSTKIWMLQK